MIEQQKNSSIDILKRAKTFLQQNTWVQGCLFLYDDSGRYTIGYCAYGAIFRVAPSRELREEASSVLQEVIYNTVGQHTIVEYNDNIAKTKEDVLLMFERAIALLERQSSNDY